MDVSIPSAASLEPTYAGAWRRILASAIDAMILWIVAIVTMGLFLLITDIPIRWAADYAIYTALNLLYFTSTESSMRRASIGKRLFGIEIQRIDGADVTISDAFGRAAVLIVLELPSQYWSIFDNYDLDVWFYLAHAIPFIGLLTFFVTKRRQCVHDLATKTVVVRCVHEDDPIRRLTPISTAIVIATLWLVSGAALAFAALYIPAFMPADLDAELTRAITTEILLTAAASSVVVFISVWVVKSHRRAEAMREFHTRPDAASPVSRLMESARGGDVESARALGELYMRGKGVVRDEDVAVQWFEIAALKGDVSSQLALAEYFATRSPSNLAAAYAWYSIAAKQGSDEANRWMETESGLLSEATRSDGQRLADTWKR